jgi:hypothetical protein
LFRPNSSIVDTFWNGFPLLCLRLRYNIPVQSLFDVQITSNTKKAESIRFSQGQHKQARAMS